MDLMNDDTNDDWDVMLSRRDLAYFSAVGDKKKIATLEELFFREVRGVQLAVMKQFRKMHALLLLSVLAVDLLFIFTGPPQGLRDVASLLIGTHVALFASAAGLSVVRAEGKTQNQTLWTLRGEQVLLIVYSSLWTLTMVLRRHAYWEGLDDEHGSHAFDREGGLAVSMLALHITVTIISTRFSFALRLVLAHQFICAGIAVVFEVVRWRATESSMAGSTLVMKCVQQTMLVTLSAAASWEWLYLKHWDEFEYRQLYLFIRSLRRKQIETNSMLMNVLPLPILIRMRNSHENNFIDAFDTVGVLFCGIVDKAAHQERMYAIGDNGMVYFLTLLQNIVRKLDEITERNNAFKIEHINDDYITCTHNILDPSNVPVTPEAISELIMFGNVLSNFTYSYSINVPDETRIRDMSDQVLANGILDGEQGPVPMVKKLFEVKFRVGITVGPVVSGIIGRSRKFFRLFGDTVNTASRVAHTAVEGEVLVTDTVRKFLEQEKQVAEEIQFDPRGVFSIKGKGEMALHAATHLCPISMPGNNADIVTAQFKDLARTMINPSSNDLLRTPIHDVVGFSCEEQLAGNGRSKRPRSSRRVGNVVVPILKADGEQESASGLRMNRHIHGSISGYAAMQSPDLAREAEQRRQTVTNHSGRHRSKSQGSRNNDVENTSQATKQTAAHHEALLGKSSEVRGPSEMTQLKRRSIMHRFKQGLLKNHDEEESVDEKERNSFFRRNGLRVEFRSNVAEWEYNQMQRPFRLKTAVFFCFAVVFGCVIMGTYAELGIFVILRQSATPPDVARQHDFSRRFLLVLPAFILVVVGERMREVLREYIGSLAAQKQRGGRTERYPGEAAIWLAAVISTTSWIILSWLDQFHGDVAILIPPNDSVNASISANRNITGTDNAWICQPTGIPALAVFSALIICQFNLPSFSRESRLWLGSLIIGNLTALVLIEVVRGATDSSGGLPGDIKFTVLKYQMHSAAGVLVSVAAVWLFMLWHSDVNERSTRELFLLLTMTLAEQKEADASLNNMVPRLLMKAMQLRRKLQERRGTVADRLVSTLADVSALSSQHPINENEDIKDTINRQALELSSLRTPVIPVVILFADIVGFTPLGSRYSPIDIARILDSLFSKFDELVTNAGLYKMDTIGDAS